MLRALWLLVVSAAVGCGASSHTGDAGAGPDAHTSPPSTKDAAAPDAASTPVDASALQDTDAGPAPDAGTAPALASDRLLASDCRQLRMDPETPQTLGFQLVHCGDTLGRLALPSGELTPLVKVTEAPWGPLVSRERVVFQTPNDQVVSVSLASGEAKSLHKGLIVGLTHDRQRVIIRDPSSAVYVQPGDGSGTPLQLCAAAIDWLLDPVGKRLVCTSYGPIRVLSVDVDSGAAQELSTGSMPRLFDDAVEQLAVLDVPARQLRVLRTDGGLVGEWSFGERNLDTLVTFSRDGRSLIVSEAEHLWAVSLADGSYHVLADRPAGEVRNQRLAARALIFESSPKLDRGAGWYDAPVTLSAVPLDGSALVTLGLISHEYSTDLQWDRPVEYALDMHGAIYPAETGGWAYSDFETLTTPTLPLGGIKDFLTIGPTPYGVSDDAAAYSLCQRRTPDCVLFVVDRAGHELMRVATEDLIDGFMLAPAAEHIIVLHGGVLELAARGGGSQRFQAKAGIGASIPYPLVTWLDARSFLYDSDGVHLVQLRD